MFTWQTLHGSAATAAADDDDDDDDDELTMLTGPHIQILHIF